MGLTSGIARSKPSTLVLSSSSVPDKSSGTGEFQGHELLFFLAWRPSHNVHMALGGVVDIEIEACVQDGPGKGDGMGNRRRVP